jgi:hypothetical protein
MHESDGAGAPGRTTGLRIRWEDSPLADIEPARPLLATLGRLLAEPDADLKLAVMRSLAHHGAGPWSIEELQDLVPWLEPSTAASVVRRVRQAGALARPRRQYQLTPEGRTVMWMVDVICRPAEASAVIRELDALIAYAFHRGDGWPVVLHRLTMAVGHLRDTRDALAALIADGKPDALLRAALSARDARDQMGALHDNHAQALNQHRLDGDAGPVLNESTQLVGEITTLVIEAHRLLAHDFQELRVLGARIGRQWVDAFVIGLEDHDLAGLLDDALPPRKMRRRRWDRDAKLLSVDPVPQRSDNRPRPVSFCRN